jgi:hypothetical protein
VNIKPNKSRAALLAAGRFVVIASPNPTALVDEYVLCSPNAERAKKLAIGLEDMGVPSFFGPSTDIDRKEFIIGQSLKLRPPKTNVS